MISYIQPKAQNPLVPESILIQLTPETTLKTFPLRHHRKLSLMLRGVKIT